MPVPSMPSCIQAYCKASPAHGFSYIANRKNIFDAAMWISVVVVSFGFCACDIGKLVAEFMSEATAVSVSMRMEGVNVSDLGICFQIDRRRLADDVEATVGEIVNDSLDAGQEIRAWLHDLAEGDDDVAENEGSMTFGLILSKISYLAFAQIIEYDVGAFRPIRFGKYTQEAVRVVNEVYAENNMRTAKQLKHLARHVCWQSAYYDDSQGAPCKEATPVIVETNGRPKCVETFCQDAIVSWLGPAAMEERDTVCLNWNHEKFPPLLRGAADKLIVSSSVVELSVVSEVALAAEPDAFGYPTIVIDLRAPVSVMDVRRRDSRFSLAVGARTSLGIEVCQLRRYAAGRRSVLVELES